MSDENIICPIKDKTNNLENAKFFWEEGNKFALEFCKSIFLFNSAITIALIAYKGSTLLSLTGCKIYYINNSIFWFILAFALSLIFFAAGYFINLNHANNFYNEKIKNTFDLGNKIQNFSYIALFVLFLFMSLGGNSLYAAFK